jgi:signal peptidase I
VVWGLVLLGLLCTRAWVVEPVRISSSSMAPTLVPGERVLVDKVAAHLGRRDRGELVVFTGPAGDALVLKRLVGLPGDRVAIRDGRLHVNGRAVPEPYVDRRTVDGVYYGPVTVPDDHVLLLGDNRGESEDSRAFGPVPTDAVQGRAVAVLWPPAEARVLSAPGWD